MRAAVITKAFLTWGPVSLLLWPSFHGNKTEEEKKNKTQLFSFMPLAMKYKCPCSVSKCPHHQDTVILQLPGTTPDCFQHPLRLTPDSTASDLFVHSERLSSCFSQQGCIVWPKPSILVLDWAWQFKDVELADCLSPWHSAVQDPRTNFGALEIGHHRVHLNSLKIAQLPLRTFQLTVAATETWG